MTTMAIMRPWRFSSSWTPANFPSLTGWWSMHRSPNLPAVSSDITSWEDISGNDRHWGQAGSDGYPVHVTLSGRPAAQFVQANTDALDIASTLATMFGNTGLIAIVVRLNGNPSHTLANNYYDANCIVMDYDQGYCGIGGRTITGTPQYVCGIYDGATKQVALTATVGQTQIVMMRRDSGGTLYASVDGGTESTVASGAPSVQTGVMGLGTSYVPRYLNGYIREVVMSTANGAAGDRTSLITYLKLAWGIS